MGIEASTFWWLAAGIAVAVELATGTFYLLMIALGLSGAAVVAMFGMGSVIQLICAALIGGGATALWHRHRFNQPHSAPARENRDVNLDIGERVKVDSWGSDGTAQVNYRGSLWTARLAPGSVAASGEHRVSAVEGNWLVLTPSP